MKKYIVNNIHTACNTASIDLPLDCIQTEFATIT
jgi:hypothetical protein